MHTLLNKVGGLGFLAFAALVASACSSPPLPQTRAVSDEAEVPEHAPDEIRLLTYNVYLRPRPVSIGDGSACRAGRIGKLLLNGEADIVALTETFRFDDVKTLTDTAAERLPYQILSQPDGTGVLGVSGGLSILSRWPIESTRTLTYSSCSGPVSDCVANKGALHAVVRTAEDARLNIVATHLDAGEWKPDIAARRAQLAQLRGFIDEIDLEIGPLVLMGDFNVDALGQTGEFDEMLKTLGVATYEVDEPSTLNCVMTTGCKGPAVPKWFDYIFIWAPDRRLRRQSTEHLAMEDTTCGSRFLSDHRAVRATFELAD